MSDMKWPAERTAKMRAGKLFVALAPDVYDSIIETRWVAGDSPDQIAAAVNAASPEGSIAVNKRQVLSRAYRMGLCAASRAVPATRSKPAFPARKFPPDADAALRANYATADSWDDLVEAVNTACPGYGFAQDQVYQRAFNIGLRQADRGRPFERKKSRWEWSAEALGEMRRLWDAGRTATGISRALSGKIDGGRTLTRSAVCGISMRLAWPERPMAGKRVVINKPRPEMRKPSAPRLPKPPRNKAGPAPVIVRPKPFPVKDVGPSISIGAMLMRYQPKVAIGVGIDILDLKTGQCKFILGYDGDDQARYCGDVCAPNPCSLPRQYPFESYCPGHRLRLYGTAQRPIPRGFFKNRKCVAA